MVASEMHPFATSGGLSEVLGALPQALTRLGHRVTVIVPRYRRVAIGPNISTVNPTPHRRNRQPTPKRRSTWGSGSSRSGSIGREIGERLSAVFVDAPELFDRDGLYGDGDGDYPDNAFRFAVFSRAALEYLRLRGRRPSVIHAHDWQAGLVPAYQKMLFSADPVDRRRAGRCSRSTTWRSRASSRSRRSPQIGLPRDVLHVEAMEFWGRVSYLKAGINFSEQITTVSPTYAREILTPELGFGFDGVLRAAPSDLVGILNGIDTDRWNPATDPFLPARYSADDLAGKAEVKRACSRRRVSTSTTAALERPLIGLVSRLTDQKGFDLIAAAADELMTLDAAWVMLGSGERRLRGAVATLAARYPGRVARTIGFDERLAHLIEAGADMFLMPSRFEPCGLNQMYSLRYGTLPDRPGDRRPQRHRRGRGRRPAGHRLQVPRLHARRRWSAAVERALDVYQTREALAGDAADGDGADFSWDVSAREYVKVYRVNS